MILIPLHTQYFIHIYASKTYPLHFTIPDLVALAVSCFAASCEFTLMQCVDENGDYLIKVGVQLVHATCATTKCPLY
jgi:hypothetical protein